MLSHNAHASRPRDPRRSSGIALLPTYALFLVLTLLPTLATAEGEVPLVMIAETSQKLDVARAYDALLAQLSDLPVALIVEWQSSAVANEVGAQVQLARRWAAENDVETIFWVDLSHRNQVFLFVGQPAGEHVLIRDLSAAGASEEARLETVAVIVRTAIKAVLEGGQIGVDSSRIHSPPQPAEEPERSWHLLAHTTYTAEPYTSIETWSHGPRIAIGLSFINRVNISLGYRFIVPITLEARQLELQLQSHVFDLGVSLAWTLGRFFVEAGASATVERLSTDVDDRDATAVATPPPDLWLFGAAPFVNIGWIPGEFATLVFGISLDCQFAPPDFVVESEGELIEIASAWAVRPLIQLGGRFTIL